MKIWVGETWMLIWISDVLTFFKAGLQKVFMEAQLVSCRLTSWLDFTGLQVK